MGKKSSLNMIWIDLEMTGLDVDKHHIIDLGMIITDKNLEPLHEPLNLQIKYDFNILAEMDDWNQTTHTNSGLLRKIETDGISLFEAERKCLELLNQWCKDKANPLCGNSVHYDRKFLEKYMPTFSEFVSFRNIDVTTFKELVRRWYPQLTPYYRESRHTAMDDIQESIAELKYYRDKILVHSDIQFANLASLNN